MLYNSPTLSNEASGLTLGRYAMTGPPMTINRGRTSCCAPYYSRPTSDFEDDPSSENPANVGGEVTGAIVCRWRVANGQ